MKEGTTMKQNALIEIEKRIAHLKKLKQEVIEVEKQFNAKESEIGNFIQDWENNCHHTFYEEQRLYGTRLITSGYYCCLCGKRIKPKYPPKKIVGKVTRSLLFPPPTYDIPTEYKEQVEEKKRQLCKIQAEKDALNEKLEKMKAFIKTEEEELNKIAHLLNYYFGYPETVFTYRDPTRDPDD